MRQWRERFRTHRKAGMDIEEAADLATADVEAEYGDSPEWEEIIERIIKLVTLILSFL